MKQKNYLSKVSLAFLAMSAVLFAACAGSSGSGEGGAAGAPDSEDEVRSASYYQELLAKPVGDCDHIQDMQFQALANLQMDQFGFDVDGKKLVVNVLLSLKKNGTYSAVYSEQKVVTETNSLVEYDTQFSKTILGKFRIENQTQLILDGFGIANKLQIGAEKKAQLKIQTRIHDPRVNSLFIVMGKTLTSVGPDGETAEQYCESQP